MNIGTVIWAVTTRSQIKHSSNLTRQMSIKRFHNITAQTLTSKQYPCLVSSVSSVYPRTSRGSRTGLVLVQSVLYCFNCSLIPIITEANEDNWNTARRPDLEDLIWALNKLCFWLDNRLKGLACWLWPGTAPRWKWWTPQYQRTQSLCKGPDSRPHSLAAVYLKADNNIYRLVPGKS